MSLCSNRDAREINMYQVTICHRHCSSWSYVNDLFNLYLQEELWASKIIVSFGRSNRVKEPMELKEAHDKD